MKALVTGVAIAMVAEFVCAPQPATAGQAQKQPTQAWHAPRTPDGQPDIQGYWTEEPGGPDSVNVETGLQTADSLRVQGWTEARIAARKPISAIIDTPDGKIPYQPWALQRRAEIVSRYGGDEATGKPQTVRDVSSELLCIIGTPRIVVFAGFQIVQTPGYVVMSWERTSDFRVIPIGDRPHLQSNVKLHNGDSRGRWEGNTLIVDTDNLNDWGWFDSKGNFHTDALTLVERFTFVDSKTMDYKVTVTDPKTFTRPWTMGFTLKQTHTPAEHYELLETACVEGERALTKILGDIKR